MHKNKRGKYVLSLTLNEQYMEQMTQYMKTHMIFNFNDMIRFAIKYLISDIVCENRGLQPNSNNKEKIEYELFGE